MKCLLLFVLSSFFSIYGEFIACEKHSEIMIFKEQLEELRYCCHGTDNPKVLQKPRHFTLQTLIRYRLRDLYLNGFMVVRGSHMKVAPLPARRQVVPGNNQGFLPETVSGSLQLTAHHT